MININPSVQNRRVFYLPEITNSKNLPFVSILTKIIQTEKCISLILMLFFYVIASEAEDKLTFTEGEKLNDKN